ncbi:MerR family transcriptional regulator [Myceligenerans xiligouense]|uniref:DNA-binding transcriptional MerR regulator n=1 Tax=Myceligenerans xiligouense TaxID=253184 RepID=A0A3N4Z334_9MICO|nr:MerR family transcriptional regulator [Myceligenerans xiligouense]RPF19512.1 DNA-binding transcriptional MerR regulator [Myceligenerans xiligouense]
MSWSIQEIARIAGTTSRTLRHYEQVGLLEPAGRAPGGARRYDQDALVRLQRILLLRDLGMGLSEIGDALRSEPDASRALAAHRDQLRAERDLVERRLASLDRTIDAIEKGDSIMAEDMFDGFDHTQHKEEVESRWGKEAYARSDAWWRGLGPQGQQEWKARQEALAREWADGASAGLDPAGDEAQAIAAKHADWLAGIPGTPGHGTGAPAKDYLAGLAEMYVADERFAANYGGAEGAVFVRDALTVYADRNL